jgi:hypothetical protein
MRRLFPLFLLFLPLMCVGAVPLTPTNPNPPDGATWSPSGTTMLFGIGSSANITLSWTGGSSEGLPVLYLVYIGTDPSNLQLYGTTLAPSIQVTLRPGSTYYWMVIPVELTAEGGKVVISPKNATVKSDIWRFNVPQSGMVFTIPSSAPSYTIYIILLVIVVLAVVVLKSRKRRRGYYR